MNTFLDQTAERLAVVFADENTNETIIDVLKDIIIEMENESQISSYHPEVVKVIYPLMIEELGDRGRGYHDSIRCIIENEQAINQTIFDGMGAPYITPEQIEKAEAARKADPFDLGELSVKESGCINLAKDLSELITNPLLPERLQRVLADEIGSLGSGKALRDFVNSPEYLAKAICEELESEE